MRDKARAGLRWIVSPAVDEVPRGHALAAAALRVLLGLLWLHNLAWKRPPDFGQIAFNDLYLFTSYAVSHPVFPPYAWVVERAVLPNFPVFGWMVLATETAVAVLLLTGTWIRAAAALGIAMSTAIALSAAYAPHEWPWSYWLMIGAHVVILFSSAGRVLCVDALRAGLSRGTVLVRVWGGLSVLMGLITIVGSLQDPLAALGFQVGSAQPSVSLGEYNAVGGLILLLTGALLLAATRVGAVAGPRLAMAGAGLALIAAVSLYVQLGFSDPLLGGSATSAGFFLCLTVVGVAVTPRLSGVPSARHAPGASPTR
ncbi:MAG: hypothetical protein WAS07_09395 [Micropruina sp.]